MIASLLLRAFAGTLLAVGLSSAGAQAPPPVPVEAFFQEPAFAQPRLSPTGRHVALAVTPRGGRTQLVVLETATLAARVVAAPADADVARIEWVNDDRLVFTVRDRETASADALLGPGLYAVQRDGSDFRQLVDRVQPFVRERGEATRMLNFFTRFHAATARRDSDDIFVVQEERDAGGRDWHATNLLRLDTRTGRATGPLQRPGRTSHWVLDTQDVPRVAVTVDAGRSVLHHFDPARQQWQAISDVALFTGADLRPVGFAPDGSFFVAAGNGRDQQALYRYDLARRSLDAQPLLDSPRFDFQGSLIADTSKLLGVRYLTDAWATAWFDPRLKDLQAQVDKLLPATVNLVDVPLRPQAPVALVSAYSDVDPGRFLLLNTESGKLTELGVAMRDIDPRRMAQVDFVRYRARDGLEVPAWLTVPRGGRGQKRPLVVLVHGGPFLRGGEWGWTGERQFLASRGYAVLEPEFRGSTGFGFTHFRKGAREWGQAMQDDIADAARWAVAQGIADPQRICVAGGSYGGYATLMGLARDGDLFRCGIAFAAVTDLDLLYSAVWSDTSDMFRAYGMPVLVGDREKDAQRLKENSPLTHAARIGQPLLLAHGGADLRVPIAHGVRLRDAVLKANPRLEWLEFTDEGHGWTLLKNRVAFWTRVERFLQAHLPP